MHLAIVGRRRHRRVMSWVAISAVLAIAGCSGDGKVTRSPVHGSVNIDGKPTAGVMVIFCPIDAPPEIQRLRPSGFTDAEGKFQLISIDPNDGAPPAHYKVLVQWPGGPKNAMGGLAGSGPDQLQGRYMNLDKAPFTVEIKPGSNDLPPFEVKSK